jgi:hypothetical protein
MAGEVELAALLCAFLAGSEQETRKYFDVNGMSRYVRVDCETDRHVIEIGLDGKSASRDSVHQALFFAHLTGKAPAVILIDRDGHEGRFEYEMRHVTKAAGVVYATCSEDFIVRWAQTRAMRQGNAGEGRDDLPGAGPAQSLCNLEALRGDGETGS